MTLGEDAADSIAVTSLQEANSADQTRGSGNCEEQARDPGDTCHETRGYWASAANRLIGEVVVGAFSVIVQPVVEPMDHFTALY